MLYKTLHRWDWDFVAEDIDGSLSGRAGDVVVFNNNLTENNPYCHKNPALFNATSCSNSKGWIRFAFNHLVPESVVLINLTNKDNQMSPIPNLAKRLTHKHGFMVALEANQEYLFQLDQAEYPTNISYEGAFYSILPNQFIIIKHKMLKKPDRVKFGNGLIAKESLTSLSTANQNGEWFWDDGASTLSYIFYNKAPKYPFLDVSVSFSAIKCRYVGCQPPLNPDQKAPVTSRPPDALYWSNISTWQVISRETGWGGYMGLKFPQTYDDVKIPENRYVVIDIAVPKLRRLQIEGILELDNNINHKLEADIIFINGGQLIAGWENDPILTNVEIILNGYKDSLDYKLPNGYDNIGGKAIGVYGGLDVHGKPRSPTWTRLSQTLLANTDQITLADQVDWLPGEQIVITTTSFRAVQNEIFIISKKLPDNKTLVLNRNASYEHIVFEESLSNGQSYKIAAAVGLLTRNVKIIGSEYEQQISDLYGFRIIVSDYSYLRSEDGQVVYYKGFARLSNVEMIHPGQFSRYSGDDSKFGILFSNLLEYNTLRPSYVRNCAFHHGFSAAVGIYISARIPIENNVIYQTIGYGLKIGGHSNIIKNNLVTMNYWASSFVPWQAPFDKEYWGAIDVHIADSAVIENNFVAGAERVGIMLRGSPCAGYSLGRNILHSIKNNTVYGALAGAAILPLFVYTEISCLEMSNFIIYKSTHYGIYYQGPASFVSDSNILIDNQINIMAIVYRPSLLTHEYVEKKYLVKNSLIVGQSPSFNCEKDRKPDDLNFQEAFGIRAFGAGVDKNGVVGLVWANFYTGSNGAPLKPW